MTTKNTYFDAVARVNWAFCHKGMIVVRNGDLTAFVIAFIIPLTENKFGPH